MAQPDPPTPPSAKGNRLLWPLVIALLGVALVIMILRSATGGEEGPFDEAPVQVQELTDEQQQAPSAFDDELMNDPALTGEPAPQAMPGSNQQEVPPAQ